ncbi:MAG: BtrH N-terminal domain-containing protein [Desulfoarculaceae bacterium]|nr:BtrH N-terminal domain-containing protein [Desulfoarculaceae bacterium]
MSLMMRHHGLQLSEAMAFGLSGALMFAYLPFVKLGGMPLIAYRRMPRAIIKGLQKNLGIKMQMQTFSRPGQGTEALDGLLAQGKIVGAQTSVFWLPYFPEEMRFHFNAHNLIVYGKEGNEYLISDPVFEAPVRCATEDLQKARFVKGVMAPKGLLYYPVSVPETIDYATIIPKIIKKNARAMLKTPVPIAGIRGIRALARNIGRLGKKDLRYARLFLGHIVRMQEEIGTGGAGFRFIYASFLQEAGRLTNSPQLAEASEMMTAVGDQWREFALLLAKAIRGKNGQTMDFPALQAKLEDVAEAEAAVYRQLLAAR